MGLFNFFGTGADINSGVRKCKADPGAVLLDVRTRQEYRSGHIEGSINIPLDTISSAEKKIKDKNTPLYVYCQSGARSRQAVSYLTQAGFAKAENIGGISRYKGKVMK